MKFKFFNLYYLATAVSCWLLLVPFAAKAQYQQFSFTQNINNPVTFNPAYAVRLNEANVQAIVRKQWVGMPGAPTTYALNATMPISAINSAVGLSLLNDTYTIERQTLFNAFFTKAIKLNYTTSLAVALNAGIKNYVVNYTSVNATDASATDYLFTNNINALWR